MDSEIKQAVRIRITTEELDTTVVLPKNQSKVVDAVFPIEFKLVAVDEDGNEIECKIGHEGKENPLGGPYKLTSNSPFTIATGDNELIEVNLEEINPDFD